MHQERWLMQESEKQQQQHTHTHTRSNFPLDYLLLIASSCRTQLWQNSQEFTGRTLPSAVGVSPPPQQWKQANLQDVSYATRVLTMLVMRSMNAGNANIRVPPRLLPTYRCHRHHSYREGGGLISKYEFVDSYVDIYQTHEFWRVTVLMFVCVCWQCWWVVTCWSTWLQIKQFL